MRYFKGSTVELTEWIIDDYCLLMNTLTWHTAYFHRCSLSMEKDGPWEIHTLTIRDVELGDAGKFQIQASNRIGKSEKIGLLTVVTEPPKFPQPLEDLQCKLGSTEVVQKN